MPLSIFEDNVAKKTQKKESAKPRPIFVLTATIIFVLLVFSPDIFPVFPRKALSAILSWTGAMFACSVLAFCLAAKAGKRGFKAPAKALFFLDSKKLFFASLFTGVLIGSVGLFRIHREVLPPITLSPLESVTSAIVRLTGDPVPWGKDFYRVEASILRFFSDENEFSASGNIALLIPKAQAEAALPGRFSLGQKALYLSKGSVIKCSGSISGAKKSASSHIVFRVAQILEASEAVSIVEKALAFRAALRLSLMKMLYGWGDSGGLFLALCSGMREFMGDSVSDIFRLAGLSHVLALSGMHLSILGGATMYITSKIAGKRLASKITLLALALFLFFAVSSPSLLRAFLFAVALTAVRRAGFQAELLPVLALVFCIHILIKPSHIYSLSFQLSYLATAGIFSIGVFFKEALDSFIPSKLCNSIAASLGAQAAVFPVSMATFAIFAPVGTLATLILSAPISIFMISGIFCALLSSIFPFLYSVCGLLMKAQYELIYKLVHFFSRFPTITAGNNPLFAPFIMLTLFFLFFVAGMFALHYLRQQRRAICELT